MAPLSISFFAHQLRHLGDKAAQRVDDLKPGDKLSFCHQPNNPVDQSAILIRADDPEQAIGYIPRYLTNDMVALVGEPTRTVGMRVAEVSTDAPLSDRLQCCLTGHIGQNAQVFMADDAYPLISSSTRMTA